jgi:hypothetical protein
VAVYYHSDTPDSTGKELPGRQQRLNAKLRDCGKIIRSFLECGMLV